jgi:hypothetical protein
MATTPHGGRIAPDSAGRITRVRPVTPAFDAALNDLGMRKQLHQGLSAVVHIVWAANDETASLERLTRAIGAGNGGTLYREYSRFAFHGLPTLPKPPEGGEGRQGGGHRGARVRRQPPVARGVARGVARQHAQDQMSQENREPVAAVTSGGNCFLLARMPLTTGPVPEIEFGGPRRAAQLKGNSTQPERDN